MPWSNDTITSMSHVRAMTFEEILSFNQTNIHLPLVKVDFYPQVNRDNILQFYGAIMQNMKDNLEVHLKQPPFSVLATVERPEEYEGYLAMRNLYCIVKDLLDKINFTDFIFEDIILPKPVRTRTILTQLISFLMFMDSRLDKNQLLEEKMVALEAERDKMAKLGPTLQRKLTDAQANLAAAELNHEQLLEKCNSLDIDMQSQVKKRTAVQETRNAAKLELTKKKEDVDKLSADVQKLRDEAKRLDSLIPQPPEEINKMIANRRAELAQMKLDMQTQRNQIVKLAAKKTVVGNWMSRMERIVGVMEHISQQMEHVRALEKSNAVLSEKGKAMRSEISDLQSTVEQMRVQLSSYDVKRDALELQHRAKVKAKKELTRHSKKNLKKLGTKFNENNIVVGSLHDEVTAQRELQEQLQKKLDNLNADFPPEYYSLKATMETFHKNVDDNLQRLYEAVEAMPVLEFE